MGKTELKKVEIEVLVALLAEIGAEVRSRREPEFILTAAFVAASGAIAWGVAALANANTRLWWSHPAIVGALGIFIIGAAVVFKIIREHGIYKKARETQGGLAKKLDDRLPEKTSLLYEDLKNPKVGPGHWFSIGIVIAAGAAAASFCLSIYFKCSAS